MTMDSGLALGGTLYSTGSHRHTSLIHCRAHLSRPWLLVYEKHIEYLVLMLLLLTLDLTAKQLYRHPA
jgi:hypothetical protein